MVISPFLQALLSSAGLAGYESPVAELIHREWASLADSIHQSRLGSVHALHRGQAAEPRPSLLISAHMDAIGMMVAGLEQGFLRLTPIGGVDPRILPGQAVIVHAKRPLAGVIVTRPLDLLPDDANKDLPTWDHLLVDLGLPARQVDQLVRPGHLVSFANPPIELGDQLICGHSLDNRVSVAALTHALELLRGRQHAWDVWFAATVQEEVTFAGAATSTFALQPNLAVIVDVTHARSPGVQSWQAFPLGEGPTLGIGPHVHPHLFKRLRALADELEIPYTIEPMPVSSGTEAAAVQVAREGVPTAVISIPLRYMHTPVEVVALTDVQRCARLLVELAVRLEPNTLQQVTWDD